MVEWLWFVIGRSSLSDRLPRPSHQREEEVILIKDYKGTLIIYIYFYL